MIFVFNIYSSLQCYVFFVMLCTYLRAAEELVSKLPSSANMLSMLFASLVTVFSSVIRWKYITQMCCVSRDQTLIKNTKIIKHRVRRIILFRPQKSFPSRFNWSFTQSTIFSLHHMYQCVKTYPTTWQLTSKPLP